MGQDRNKARRVTSTMGTLLVRVVRYALNSVFAMKVYNKCERRWNAAWSFATYLDTHPEVYEGKCVLELGAGGGLPGIVAAKNGAEKVTCSLLPRLYCFP